MLISISQTNPDPLYKQIADQVRDAIASGDLKPGEALPSIREMADALGVSVITVKRSYADLDAEGLLLTRPGLGCFVAEVDRETLRSRKLVEIQRELAKTVASAKRFGISGSDVGRLLSEIKEV